VYKNRQKETGFEEVYRMGKIPPFRKMYLILNCNIFRYKFSICRMMMHQTMWYYRK